MSRRLSRRMMVLVGAVAGLVLVPAATASAHPLGNFTVNHYNGMSLSPDRVDVLAIVDSAEIPTAQEMPAIDTDGSGAASDSELSTYAVQQCAEVAAAITADVDGTTLSWEVGSTSLETVPGVAALPTLRLTCELSSAATLDGAATVTLVDSYRSDRVGWHEITAVGDGVRLLDPPVAQDTISDELRRYPSDLLLSPLDQRSVTLETEPGSGVSGGPGDLLDGPSADPFTRFIAAADRYLEDLIGPDLTLWVGFLAVLLAVLLGAGHAILPGHGKTVMAAYLAGRRGSRRDAVIVGATVTGTHTAGVLVLGLLISLSSAIAGEQVLRWLGVFSGLLVAGIGLALLRSALRARRNASTLAAAAEPVLAGAQADFDAHDHGQHHGDGHGHAHDHDHAHADDQVHDGTHDQAQVYAHAHAEAHVHGDAGHSPGDATHSHGGHADGDASHSHGDAGHSHGDAGHSHGGHADGDAGHSHGGHADGDAGHSHGDAGHSHGDAGHSHSHGFGHSHSHGYSRGGLIGMGIAGGLVPSPSALIVLLASIGLGRTLFGVLLVFAYGLGMAGTLTAVGLLLVRLRGRLARMAERATLRRGALRVAAALPVLTALLVLVVGVALAARGVLSPV